MCFFSTCCRSLYSCFSSPTYHMDEQTNGPAEKRALIGSNQPPKPQNLITSNSQSRDKSADVKKITVNSHKPEATTETTAQIIYRTHQAYRGSNVAGNKKGTSSTSSSSTSSSD